MQKFLMHVSFWHGNVKSPGLTRTDLATGNILGREFIGPKEWLDSKLLWLQDGFRSRKWSEHQSWELIGLQNWSDFTPELIWFQNWSGPRNDRRVTWWQDYSSLSTNLDRGNRTDLALWLIWSQYWSCPRTDIVHELIWPQDWSGHRTDLVLVLLWPQDWSGQLVLLWPQYWSGHRTDLATGLIWPQDCSGHRTPSSRLLIPMFNFHFTELQNI